MMFTLVATAMAEGSGPVAQIGEITYATLKAAFEGAKDGDTITLTDDIKVEDTLVVTKTWIWPNILCLTKRIFGATTIGL